MENQIEPQQISINTRSRSSTKTKKHNPSDYFGRFSVISTLHSAIRLAVYNCSHRQGKIPVIHRKSKIIVEIPEGCQIIFNCGLYHHGVKSWLFAYGQWLNNIRSFFMIVENGYSTNEIDYLSITTPGIFCEEDCSICKKLQSMKLCFDDLLKSNIGPKRLKNLPAGVLIMGNLDLVGWAVIKTKESWENSSDVKNNILKINSITSNNKIWADLESQNGRQTFYSDNNDTENFVSPINLCSIFDENWDSVKTYLMKVDPLFKNIGESHIIIKENLIRNNLYLDEYQPIHCDFICTLPMKPI